MRFPVNGGSGEGAPKERGAAEKTTWVLVPSLKLAAEALSYPFPIFAFSLVLVFFLSLSISLYSPAFPTSPILSIPIRHFSFPNSTLPFLIFFLSSSFSPFFSLSHLHTSFYSFSPSPSSSSSHLLLSPPFSSSLIPPPSFSSFLLPHPPPPSPFLHNPTANKQDCSSSTS